jgi:hypothetical protein
MGKKKKVAKAKSAKAIGRDLEKKVFRADNKIAALDAKVDPMLARKRKLIAKIEPLQEELRLLDMQINVIKEERDIVQHDALALEVALGRPPRNLRVVNGRFQIP